MWQSTTWDDYNDAWGAAAVQDPSAAGGTAASIAPASYWCMSLSQEKTNSVEQAQAKKTEAYNTTTKNSLKAFHGVEDEPSYATDRRPTFLRAFANSNVTGCVWRMLPESQDTDKEEPGQIRCRGEEGGRAGKQKKREACTMAQSTDQPLRTTFFPTYRSDFPDPPLLDHTHTSNGSRTGTPEQPVPAHVWRSI